MMRVLVFLGCFVSSMIFAIQRQEVINLQAEFAPYEVYITSTGQNVNLLIPVNVLFEGETTYTTDLTAPLVELISLLILRSKGKVFMEGVLTNQSAENTINTSALYMQVSSFAKLLLSRDSGVSYAPIKMKKYDKNPKYGIWKLYPKSETFINLNLNID